MEEKLILDTHEKPTALNWLSLSAQHVLAMFGATVLVPMLTGLPVGLTLISSGIGTLIYILCTKGKVPAFLGSSFAFIAPVVSSMNAEGQGGVTGGLIMVGISYLIVGFIIKFAGTNWVHKALPPVVVGPTIMIIGLYLAPVAVRWSTETDGEWVMENAIVALITLLVAIFISAYTKGLFQLLPIFFGILVGYIAAVVFGLVDFSAVQNVGLFNELNFAIFNYRPVFSLEIAALMIPVSIVTITEHIGDILLLNDILKRDLTKEPGLHRTLIGDGLASLMAGLIGGPANTTYGENIGVVGLTKVASVWVIGGAAVVAIALGFIAPFTALISTIPLPVMGGVSILLFGIIASCGARIMINGRVNLGSQRNLIIASVILVIGVGNMTIDFGAITIGGMALAAIVGIILNLILPDPEKKTAE
jgi:uracil permease